ncbi:hypothetical protein B0H34DRAFT_802836 [Crassisporium funariophilum]|nr:hypothetical protein B0H34DRAFT_802836 [Crassisporium funariophilum]
MGSRSIDSLLNGIVDQMRKKSPQWSDSNKAGGSSTSAAVDRTIRSDQISISLMASPIAELLGDDVKGMILDPQRWPDITPWEILGKISDFFTALQLWHNAKKTNPGENFETNFDSAQELLMSLQLLSKYEFIHKMNKITPDFTIIGLNKLNKGLDDTIPEGYAGRSPIVTLEIKSVRIVEKVYEEKYLRSSELRETTKMTL